MAYIYPAPGNATHGATLTVNINGVVGDLVVPALQDVTLNAANDVFTWTQLDEGSKLQIATTATNSLAMNIVLDQTVFFGDSGETSGTAPFKGIFGMSSDKDLVDFELYFGSTSDQSGTANGKTVSGQGYITGLAPTVSADAPVWVSPITITVTGDYTVA